jgi:glycine cleavage system H protein
MSPEECKYTEDHEWVAVEGGIATIGISQHAINELGEIVYVELPNENNQVYQKDEFGTVESVKTVSSLYAPITGTIVEVNTLLEKNPEILNESPYSDGWLIKIEYSDENELIDLMTYEEYSSYLETL